MHSPVRSRTGQGEALPEVVATKYRTCRRTSTMRILLIEPQRADSSLTEPLRDAGIDVERCTDAFAAEQLLRLNSFDVVIADLNLLGSDGLAFVRGLRQREEIVPVLLTGANSPCHRALGLNAGADDCLSHPFELVELEARLNALHRRGQQVLQATVRIGTLRFDAETRRFSVRDVPFDLPPRERTLLEALINGPRRTVSRDELVRLACSDDEVLSHDALDVYVHRLRRRLTGSGASIRTLRGLGYALEAANKEGDRCDEQQTSLVRRAPSG